MTLQDDIEMMFANSLRYNTDRKSAVVKMTKRLKLWFKAGGLLSKSIIVLKFPTTNQSMQSFGSNPLENRIRICFVYITSMLVERSNGRKPVLKVFMLLKFSELIQKFKECGLLLTFHTLINPEYRTIFTLSSRTGER